MREATAAKKPRATDEPRRHLKIGEVSRLSGIGIEALRFYEKSCLLAAS